MISRLFKRTAAKRPIDVARIPDGMRVYAIGDVHGRNDLLKALLAKIEADNAARPASNAQLIFLGDLMDRGPDSAGVIETAMAARSGPFAVRFLMGNHEEVFIKMCREVDAKLARFFIRIGGEATALSYPISRQRYQQLDLEELCKELQRIVPAEHVAFLESFEDQITIGDYAFVHAGIRPDVPMAAQTPSDLRWIREEFVGHRGDLEKVIVYGHTIYDDVEERGSRIGIDTGAYASGKLTAIGLEGGERWFLRT